MNDFIHDVAIELDKRGYVVGKFKPLSHAALWPMPPKPVDMEDPESLKGYKEATKDAYNAKKDYERSMHIRTTIPDLSTTVK